MTVLLDAGPALNFLAVGQQNILVRAAASANLQLAAPRRVDAEVRGMTKNPRFARTGALSTWSRMCAADRIRILDDTLDGNPDFTSAVTRVSGKPAKDRVRDGKSLGEILVIAHASTRAQTGQDVFILIDDGDGRTRAQREIAWLTRQQAPGRVTLWKTQQVLHAAKSQPGWIVDGLTAEQVYEKMRAFDEGLPPLAGRKL